MRPFFVLINVKLSSQIKYLSYVSYFIQQGIYKSHINYVIFQLSSKLFLSWSDFHQTQRKAQEVAVPLF